MLRNDRFAFVVVYVALSGPFISILICRQLGLVSKCMINAYCGSLDGTFAQMVYYGIIKKEDAQCFRVNTSIDGGFFILAAAAVLLALLNTFVLKAVRQYDRDKDQQEHDKAQNSAPRRSSSSQPPVPKNSATMQQNLMKFVLYRYSFPIHSDGCWTVRKNTTTFRWSHPKLSLYP